MAAFIGSQGRFVEEISRFEEMKKRIVERERFFTGRSATELLFDSATIRMERSLSERFKIFEQLQSMQNIIQQSYSPAMLEQMSRMAYSINCSARWFLPQNLSEVSKAAGAFQQSDWYQMTETAKMSMGVLSSIPILRNWEYEEEQLRKSAEILHKVEAVLEKIPPELQDAFWDTPLDKIPLSIVLDPNLTDEQRAAELATFFAGGEIESAWSQIRRILYPVINGHVAPLVTLFGILATVSAAKDYYNAFCYFISWAFIFWVIDVEGEPTEEEFLS